MHLHPHSFLKHATFVCVKKQWHSEPQRGDCGEGHYPRQATTRPTEGLEPQRGGCGESNDPR